MNRADEVENGYAVLLFLLTDHWLNNLTTVVITFRYVTLRYFVTLQTQLLEDHIKELKRVLKPGAKRLNWNSLGISDYIARCGQVKLKICLVWISVLRSFLGVFS